MKIALVQSSLAWGNVDENLKNFDDKLRQPLDSDVILLPEMFVSGGMTEKKSVKMAGAEKMAVAGRFTEVREKMKEWAKGQDALLIGSTVCEETGRFYNRLIVAFPNGHCLYYDKRHCFTMGGESEHFSPGKDRLVFDFREMKIAVFICYDLRFPVWCRNTQNYDLALFVANWPESRREVWKTLLKARAIENQAFIAGVNCVGTDADGLRYAGDSMVCDACGNELVRAKEYREEIITTDCNMHELYNFRCKFPVLEDRDCFSFEMDDDQ